VLLLAVYEHGTPIGMQDVRASDFDVSRKVGSGSWLGRRFQGRGLGTEMRQAMLHLVFEGLGALTAESGAWADNVGSIRVSDKCGYSRNGVTIEVRRRGDTAPGGPGAERMEHVNFRIDRDAWKPRRRMDIELVGVDEELLAMCGVSDARRVG
jgi:RimJ/RimL family protein N-acetyltransferase